MFVSLLSMKKNFTCQNYFRNGHLYKEHHLRVDMAHEQHEELKVIEQKEEIMFV